MAILDVVVVGAGVAGTAAAWRAKTRGASVRICSGRIGTSGLYSGIVDGFGSDQPTAELRGFVADLGIWKLAMGSAARFATSAGILRGSAGADVGLLDLAPLAGRRVAVADPELDGFQAELLAASYADTAWARETRTEFFALPVALAKYEVEKRFPTYDFAALHDEPSRAEWFCERLRARAGAADAWLVGPWLGTTPESIERIRARSGAPIGEIASNPGETAGARFERAKGALLARLGCEIEAALVTAVRGEGEHLLLDVQLPDLDRAESMSAKTVVLATGGVASGGIVYRGASGDPGGAFELSLNAPVSLELDGVDATGSSSTFGFNLAARGLGALERVGISVSRRQQTDTRGIFAAGDCVAGGVRSVLDAAAQGIRAADAALELAISPTA